MWVELLRGAIIAVTFFGLGALWVMGRWRRSLRARRPAPGTVVGVATEDVQRGQLLTVDLRPYFPADDEPRR